MRKIFESNQTSINGLHRVVTLWGENYDGISTNIQGGGGFNHIVQNDWSDFLQVGQEVRLIKLDNTEKTAEVTSFNYSSSTNTTSIGLDETFDADYVIIKSNDFFPIFNPEINDLETTWEAQGDKILQPIKSSYTDIRYYNRDAWFDRFLDLYLRSKEDDWKLTIHIGGTQLEWCGNIVTDLIQWENHPKPRVYHFKATDGIDRLKGVTYDRVADALPNFNVAASPYKIIDHVMACLSANGLEEFWSNDDIYIYESAEIYSAKISGNVNEKSLFAYSYLTNSIFYDRGSSDPVRYKSCYEVLEDICRLFSLRLIFSLGAYYFQQVRNFRQDPQIESRAFKKDKTYTNVNYTFKFEAYRGVEGGKHQVRVLGHGMYGYFAGLAEARIDFFRHISLQIEDGFTYRGGTGVSARLVELGDVEAGVGQGKSLNISFAVRSTIPPSGSIVNMTILRIRVWIENASGDITHCLINNSNTGAYFWRGATSNTDKGGTLHVFRNRVIPEHRNFNTAEIPASGKLRMDIRFIQANRADTFSHLKVRVPTLNNLPETNEIILKNYDDNYSQVMEFEPLIITENNTTTSTNSIWVNGSYPSGGFNTAKQATDDWKLPVGNVTFEDILSAQKLREAMAVQFKPVGKYMGTFAGIFFAHQAPIYDDAIWIMNGMTINYMLEENSGEWFESIATTKQVEEDLDNPVFNPIDPDNGRQGEFAVPQDNTTNIIDGLGKNLCEVTTTNTIFQTSNQKYLVSRFITDNEEVLRLKEGDFINIVDPINNAKIVQIEVDEVNDLGGGIYEVKFDNLETDAPIVQGNYITISEDKNIITEVEVRAKNIVTSDDLTVSEIGDLKDGSIQINGSKLYFKSGGTLYEIQGTPTV